MLRFIAMVVAFGLTVGEGTAQSDPVRVVATLPVYADLVEKIGGTQVDVSAIAAPNEDAHFVRPKPSFALSVRRADLFITTGLDLELWAPTVLDRAGNRDVSEGGNGYVTAYTGIELLDVPAAADRSGGDVHIFGNPHVTRPSSGPPGGSQHHGGSWAGGSRPGRCLECGIDQVDGGHTSAAIRSAARGAARWRPARTARASRHPSFLPGRRRVRRPSAHLPVGWLVGCGGGVPRP